MAEENKDPRNFPPPLPGAPIDPGAAQKDASFPGLPPFLPPDALQPSKSLPPLPGFPPSKNASLPGLPPLPSLPAARPNPNAQSAPQEHVNIEKKISELEKKLQEEREKVLMAQLKNQQEAVTSAKVESSLKELQEKIRRERRDQETEESRLRLENKLREMEARLAQERETWVSTLKSQMQSRESQDKDIETQFIGRIQEMEKRWIEEKMQWQKALSAKEEEARNWRMVAEKMRVSEIELGKALIEKKSIEEKIKEIEKKNLELENRYGLVSGNLVEREKELAKIKAELTLEREAPKREIENLERLLKGQEEKERRLLGEMEILKKEFLLKTEFVIREKDDKIKEIIRDKDSGVERLQASYEKQIAMSKTAFKEAEEKYAASIEKLRLEKKAEIQVLRDGFQKELEVALKSEEEKAKRLHDEISHLKEQVSQVESSAAREKEKALDELRIQFQGKILELAAQSKEREASLNSEIQRLRSELEHANEPLVQAKAEHETEIQKLKAASRMELDALRSENSVLKTNLAAIEAVKTGMEEELSRLKNERDRMFEQSEAKLRDEAARIQAGFRLQMEALRESAQSKEEKLKTEIAALRKEKEEIIGKYQSQRELESRNQRLELEAEIKSYQEKIEREKKEEVERLVASKAFAIAKEIEEKSQKEKEREFGRLRLAAATEQKNHQEKEKEYQQEMSSYQNRLIEMEKKIKELTENEESYKKQMSDVKMREALIQAEKISAAKKEERLRAALAAVRGRWEKELEAQARKKAEELFGIEKARLQTRFQQEVEQKAEEVSRSLQRKMRQEMEQEMELEKEKMAIEERRKVENEIARLKDESRKEQKDLEETLAAYMEMKRKKEEAERLCSAQGAQLSFVRKEVEKLQEEVRQRLAKK